MEFGSRKNNLNMNKELQAEAARIREKYPGRITVFVERAAKTDIPDIDKKKFSVPGDTTVGQFVHIIRKKIKLSPDKAIFIFVKNILPSTAALMSAIYEEHKAEDGILYMTYSGENAFGSSLNGEPIIDGQVLPYHPKHHDLYHRTAKAIIQEIKDDPNGSLAHAAYEKMLLHYYSKEIRKLNNEGKTLMLKGLLLPKGVMKRNLTSPSPRLIMIRGGRGGLALEPEELVGNDQLFYGYDAKLCVVARFISDGRVDFQAMQQTLVALRKSGMGIYIKDLEANLFLFQFYHEVDIKRIMEGCPWSFNMRALIMARMKEGDNHRNVDLNKMDIWVQIYDLKAELMTERILKQVGNYIGTYVSSCPSNFVGVWRDYLRVQVSIDVPKPLKKRMKVRKSGEEWDGINFKYENVLPFCFICELLGHSDKYCSSLFVTKESDIVRPCGELMRAPFRRHVKSIDAKWLCNGSEGADRRATREGSQNSFKGSGNSYDPRFTPVSRGTDIEGLRDGTNIMPTNIRKEVIVIKSKKCRTEGNVDDPMGMSIEVMMDSEEEDNVSNKQSDPEDRMDSKNVSGASTQGGTRLAL
ncbi:hypothetical protein AgCh_014288 [Apium graveolens]